MKNQEQERHQPDPLFVERLEWQLMTEMRQSRRSFNQKPPQASRWRSYLRVAALVVVSALGGMALIKAAQGLERNWQHQLELARAETEAQLAASRAELAQDYLDSVREKAASGEVDPDSLAWAEFEVYQVEHQLLQASIDLEEMKLSGRSPRHELYAPLVEGRDFVTRRLHSQMDLLQKKLEVAQRMFDIRRKEVESGVSPSRALAAAEQDMAHVRSEIEHLGRRLRLRQSFLRGDLSAQQLIARSRLAEVQARVQMLDKRLQAGAQEVEELRRRVETGEEDPLQLRHMEFELQRIEAEHRLASLELELMLKHAGR
ncbi:MAG TPA: hypothetical protein VLU25_09975 [Acidobacteriota bacterium]|nr:hypothetical protein [Acidobacteriota bacterium]